MSASTEKWDWKIDGSSNSIKWELKEIWTSRHLLGSLIHRDFILNYQQTLLGPFWTLLQPIFTLVVYVLVFNRLVGIGVGALPPVLFYFSGIILWNLFSETFSSTSSTLRNNYNIYTKVYFPRLIMPLSVLGTNLLRLLIQLLVLFFMVGYYWWSNTYIIAFSWHMLLLPLIIIMVAAISFGTGLIISVISTKYRDLSNLISILIRLLMFITPIIYPLGAVKEHLRWLVLLNPLTPLFEAFRFCLFGEGVISVNHLVVSVFFAIIISFSGFVLFNKKSSSLLDVA